jgi:primosomal protein N' (replication factor Y)
MVRLVTRGPSERATEEFANLLQADLQQALEARGLQTRVLGPAPAPIAKLRGKYRFHLLLLDHSGEQLRDAVQAATMNLQTPEEIQWIVDVDPLDML